MAEPKKPTKRDVLRARHPWLDHLVRAGARYTESHGDHYAAAITYFSVLALVPLLMIAFAVGGYVLAFHPDLLNQVRDGITTSAPAGLRTILNGVVDQAINQRNTVGILGLLGAAYSGLGWMANLREALTAQWGQRNDPPSFLTGKLADSGALLGLGLALVLSFGLTAAGSGLADVLLRLVGLGGVGWARAVTALTSILLSLAANWLVFCWVIAKLPREPVTLRSAARAALIAAVGFGVLQQAGTYYLQVVSSSPAGAAFGPIIGLLLFANLVSRLLLFLTAWAATLRENELAAVPPVPARR